MNSMNKRFKTLLGGRCVLLYFLVGISPAETQVCIQPPLGMTGWWPGDGNAKDIIGERNAVLRDNATTEQGLVDGAFALDGNGDFVEVPHSTALNVGTGDFAVDLWVNFINTSGEQMLKIH